jgi:hypothetical protein
MTIINNLALYRYHVEISQYQFFLVNVLKKEHVKMFPVKLMQNVKYILLNSCKMNPVKLMRNAKCSLSNAYSLFSIPAAKKVCYALNAKLMRNAKCSLSNASSQPSTNYYLPTTNPERIFT